MNVRSVYLERGVLVQWADCKMYALFLIFSSSVLYHHRRLRENFDGLLSWSF